MQYSGRGRTGDCVILTGRKPKRKGKMQAASAHRRLHINEMNVQLCPEMIMEHKARGSVVFCSFAGSMLEIS